MVWSLMNQVHQKGRIGSEAASVQRDTKMVELSGSYDKGRARESNMKVNNRTRLQGTISPLCVRHVGLQKSRRGWPDSKWQQL